MIAAENTQLPSDLLVGKQEALTSHDPKKCRSKMNVDDSSPPANTFSCPRDVKVLAVTHHTQAAKKEITDRIEQLART